MKKSTKELRYYKGIDTRTGEELPELPVLFQKEIKHSFGKEYFVGFNAKFKEIAKDKDLNWESGRVFYFLLGSLDYQNFVLIRQKNIAEELQMSQPQVSRALKKLEKKGYVTIQDGVDRVKAYRISSEAAWKGSGKSFKKHNKLSEKISAKEAAKISWQKSIHENRIKLKK